jgi:hypothetical protein
LRERAEKPHEVETVFVGQAEVDDHEIECLLRTNPSELGPRCCLRYVEPISDKIFRDGFPLNVDVLNNDDMSSLHEFRAVSLSVSQLIVLFP